MILEDINKLLIIRLSSLGDILLTTPLIRSIKKINPEIDVDFVLREEYRDILIHNPHIRRVFTYANSKFEKQNLFNKLISENYELAIDLHNNLRTKEFLRLLKCRVLKFDKRNIDKFFLVRFKINRMRNAPSIPERYSQTIDGSILDGEALEIVTNKNPDSRLQNDSNFIGLCPGAKHYTKRWSLNNYLELGKLLEANNYRIVLFGGRYEIELCSSLAQELSNPVNLCNADILQTATNMKQCKLIYCNDSGLMHLATSVGTPVIAFFGSTVKEFGFYPYGSKSLVLENKNLACRPCTHIGRKNCPKKHFDCMLKISPGTAFNSLSKLLDT